MHSTIVIAWREFKAYFNSAIAYIVVCTFLALVNFFFFFSFFTSGVADVRNLFTLASIISAFFGPAITMKLIADERKSRSIELLLSLPVTRLQVILGKYFAALLLYLVMIALTLFAPITISGIASLEWGPIIGSYIGLLMLGSVYVAIGLFTSALTKSQLVAVILGIAACLTVSLGFEYARFFAPSFIGAALEHLSVLSHFQSMARGVLDTRDIIYYLSASTFLVALSVYFLDREAA